MNIDFFGKQESRSVSKGTIAAFDTLMLRARSDKGIPVPKRIEDIISTQDPVIISILMEDTVN